DLDDGLRIALAEALLRFEHDLARRPRRQPGERPLETLGSDAESEEQLEGSLGFRALDTLAFGVRELVRERHDGAGTGLESVTGFRARPARSLTWHGAPPRSPRPRGRGAARNRSLRRPPCRARREGTART